VIPTNTSAGTESRTIGGIVAAASAVLGKRTPRFSARLAGPIEHASSLLGRMPKQGALRRVGALLSGSIPFITTDIVYDNTRAVSALGTEPAPFTSYGAAPCAYAKSVGFEFPYRALPEEWREAEAAGLTSLSFR
jgi:hypothetical protein